jgi:hypothetical protein
MGPRTDSCTAAGAHLVQFVNLPLPPLVRGSWIGNRNGRFPNGGLNLGRAILALRTHYTSVPKLFGTIQGIIHSTRRLKRPLRF